MPGNRYRPGQRMGSDGQSTGTGGRSHGQREETTGRVTCLLCPVGACARVVPFGEPPFRERLLVAVHAAARERVEQRSVGGDCGRRDEVEKG